MLFDWFHANLRVCPLRVIDMSRNGQGLALAGTLSILLALPGIGCKAQDPSRQLTLATTTSVANSGLLDVLLVAFRQQHGIVIRSHLVGSGLALRMLETGDVDIVISHAPITEASFLKAHPGWQYRKIMFNDFVLVGPTSDPAGVIGTDNVSVGMRRIADSNARFVSRGDGSGTHEREQQLWMLAGARPASGRFVVAGSGMGTTLRIASDIAAYTLTDRATLARYEGALQLVIVCEGGPLLVNTYAVSVNPYGRHAEAAGEFFRWITGDGGRLVIDSYRIRGMRAFEVWPAAALGDRPDAQPH